MSGVSIAFAAAVGALARVIGKTPLPAGLNTGETEDWHFALNASRETIKDNEGSDLTPWTIVLRHKRFFVITVLDPTGGMIGGGMGEDELIAQMEAIGLEQVPA